MRPDPRWSTTQQELQELIDRERIVALVSSYLVTVDDACSLDAQWARSLFRGPTPPAQYLIANECDAVAVHTSDGWRFQTPNLRPVWSSGLSHLDMEASDR